MESYCSSSLVILCLFDDGKQKVDGIRIDGWDGHHRSSKSTFGANKDFIWSGDP